MKTCFISTDHIKKLLEIKKNEKKFGSLENLVVLDEENFDFSDFEEFSEIINLYKFSDVVEKGEEKVHEWAEVTGESIYTFSYTSGTTGTPKGAMISHKNIVSLIPSVKEMAGLHSEDSYLSYLPMAHIMEKGTFNMALYF